MDEGTPAQRETATNNAEHPASRNDDRPTSNKPAAPLSLNDPPASEYVPDAAALLEGLASARFVDLTHPFDDQTIFWPTEEGFRFLPGVAGVTERGYYYSANRFSSAEHGGTHIDAPIHFFANRPTVDEIPLERLCGPGAVVDVSEACINNPDYLVTVADLREWEERHGETLAERIVLLRTGWDRYWPFRQEYLGTSNVGEAATQELHFPGLDPQAARWLVEHRHIRAVGIDTASIDHGPSRDFASHVILCEHDTPALENVANLSELPSTGFWIVALPMKIAGGSGAPTRVMAVVGEAAQ